MTINLTIIVNRPLAAMLNLNPELHDKITLHLLKGGSRTISLSGVYSNETDFVLASQFTTIHSLISQINHALPIVSHDLLPPEHQSGSPKIPHHCLRSLN